MKLICKIFGHKWRWFIIDKPTNKFVRVCKVCGKVHHYRWHMTGFIWVKPVEYTLKGAQENIENYDGI